jgi:hypothetical protein
MLQRQPSNLDITTMKWRHELQAHIIACFIHHGVTFSKKKRRRKLLPQNLIFKTFLVGEVHLRVERHNDEVEVLFEEVVSPHRQLLWSGRMCTEGPQINRAVGISGKVRLGISAKLISRALGATAAGRPSSHHGRRPQSNCMLELFQDSGCAVCIRWKDRFHSLEQLGYAMETAGVTFASFVMDLRRTQPRKRPA